MRSCTELILLEPKEGVTMKTYDDYLSEVKILIAAGHNRFDVLKALHTLYLLNDGDESDDDDELRNLIMDIENKKHEALFR
tara:strand:- start:1089 stop:1331 length:243 start_codon:yes stop_codon:yes gene_type:complete